MTKIDYLPGESQFYETFWSKNYSEDIFISFSPDSDKLAVTVKYYDEILDVSKANAELEVLLEEFELENLVKIYI